MFDVILAPSVIWWTRLSKKGVVAAPVMCWSWAYFKACWIAFSIFYAFSVSWLGTATKVPVWSPSLFWTTSISAISSILSIEIGDSIPEEGAKKAGKYLLPYVTTGTPSVYKYYKVRAISKIFLTPAETTVTGVLPNSRKSALTSIVY